MQQGATPDGLVFFGSPGVRVGGQVVPLKPAVSRLLGLLFASRGAVVTRQALIERLWCGRPPASARSALRTYVGQIRRAVRPLGGAVELATIGQGYCLRVARSASDLGRLEEVLQTSTDDIIDGSYSHVVDRLGAFVKLGVQHPFDGCEDDSLVAAEIFRGFELLRTATERYVVALVEVDRIPEALAELSVLTTRQPGDERLVGLEMWALARRGRRRQAFESYESCATWLWDEFGTRPGAELEEMAQTIAAGGATPAPAF